MNSTCRWLQRAALRSLGVWIGVALCACTGANAALPDDFAEGLALRPTGDAPLQRIELPFAVYAGSARRDLGDVRVFAPDGSEVPYALVARTASASAPSFEAVPIFPLPAAAASASAIDVRVDSAGAVVSVQGAPAASADVRTWLVDTGAAGPPVRELLLRFAGEGDVLGSIDVDGGATLQAFAARVRGAQVARLRHEGRALDQLRVALPSGDTRYLRLTLRLEGDAATSPPALEAVLARRATQAGPAPRHTPWLRGRASEGRIAFDLGARLPLQAVELDLGVDNSFVLAQFECRDRSEREGEQAVWQPLGVARIHRLRRGATVQRSEPVPVAGVHCVQLRVHAGAASGNAGEGRVATLPAEATLRAAWLPAELWFLRRGDGEHLLAFGANLVAPAPLPLAALRADAGHDAAAAGTGIADVGEAGIGGTRTLGGADRRQATPPIDWKQSVLWMVLLAGVALVVLLAWRVMRDTPARG